MIIIVNLISKVTWIFLAMLCLASCSNEDPSNGKRAELKLSLKQSTGANGLGTDPVINSVRIMVFDDKGYIDTNKKYKLSDGNPFKVPARLGRDRSVVVVANETEDMNLSSILKRTELEEVMQPECKDTSKDKLTSDLSKVLVGELTPLNIDESSSGREQEVVLRRAYAKLTIRIAKQNKTDKIELLSLKLCNMSSKTPLFDGNLTRSNQLYDVEKNLNNKVVPLLPAGGFGSETDDVVIKDYYVYEQLGNSGVLDKQPTLKVKALFNGAETSYSSVISFDVIGSQIKRNNSCAINAKITKIGKFDGMTLETEIEPWTEETIDKEFAMAYLKECEYFDPDDELWYNFDPEHRYQVNPNLPAKFKLKIHSDIPDLEWRANLSNGLNFSVTPSTGKVNELVEIEVKSSIPNVRIPVDFELTFVINRKFVVASHEESKKRATIKLRQSPR